MKKIFYLFVVPAFLLISPKENPIHFEIENLWTVDSTCSFRGIFAIDKNTAFVSGSNGSFYITKNGGENWENRNPKDCDSLDFRDVAVIKPGTIILMSAGTGKNSKIIKSTDNGKTWKIVYKNPYSEGFLDSIEFWNENKGIAIGDPVFGKFNILLTNDGGESWQEVDSSKIPDAVSGEAQFAASGTCISVIGENYAWIATGGKVARVLKTSDNGINWEIFNTPILQGQSATGIFSVHFWNNKNGIIVGGDYLNEINTDSTAAFTEDGGKTWRLINFRLLPYQSSVKSILINGENICISTGPAGTYFCKNNNNWKLIGKTGFNSLCISKNDNSIWAAGSKGKVGKLIMKN